MQKEIVKDTIDINDLIDVRGDIYSCAPRTERSCAKECSMFDDEQHKCLGVCYRYDRDDIVFKYRCPAVNALPSWTICKTSHAGRVEQMMVALELERKREDRHRRKAKTDNK